MVGSTIEYIIEPQRMIPREIRQYGATTPVFALGPPEGPPLGVAEPGGLTPTRGLTCFLSLNGRGFTGPAVA